MNVSNLLLSTLFALHALIHIALRANILNLVTLKVTYIFLFEFIDDYQSRYFYNV